MVSSSSLPTSFSFPFPFPSSKLNPHNLASWSSDAIPLPHILFLPVDPSRESARTSHPARTAPPWQLCSPLLGPWPIRLPCTPSSPPESPPTLPRGLASPRLVPLPIP